MSLHLTRLKTEDENLDDEKVEKVVRDSENVQVPPQTPPPFLPLPPSMTNDVKIEASGDIVCDEKVEELGQENIEVQEEGQKRPTLDKNFLKKSSVVPPLKINLYTKTVCITMLISMLCSFLALFKNLF